MTGLEIAAGWMADLIAGDPKRFHPVAGFGRLAGALERRLWRDTRTAGVAFVATLVGLPALGGWMLDRRLASGRMRSLLRAVVLWAAVGGRSLVNEANGIASALEDGDLVEARRRLPALVGRDPSGLDAAEVSRAVVESVAENTGDAVVAPLLWGAVAGPAGVVAYRCANTLDAMVGHHNDRYERFGWAAARLDDAMNWVPARAGAGLTAVVAPALGGNAGIVVATVRRDGAHHPSPNAGRLEAAFAGGLSVQLGGTNRYGERVEQRGPLGEGQAPSPEAIRQATRLAGLVGLASCAAAAAVVGARR